jgi:hypothetical protein
MGVSIPQITGLSMSKFTGKTSELGPKGMSADYRQFSVGKGQEYNFTITNPQMKVTILNSKNEVVTTITSENQAASNYARLAAGEYTALISQRYKGVNNKDYELQITERTNTMLTAGGAIMKGTARGATGSTDTGVQKHTLNIVQGGSFDINLTMPYSRYAIMDKNGKVVSSGDTMKPNETKDYIKTPGTKLDPGVYEVVMVFPRNIDGEVPWNLSFTPKMDIPAVATKERDVDRILRERDARLQKWAAADAKKKVSTKA